MGAHAVHGLRAEADKVSDLSESRPKPPDQLHQLGPHEEDARFRVIDQVFQLFFLETRVEGGRDETDLHGRAVHVGVLDAVPGEDAQHVALAGAHCLERADERVHPLVEPREGDRFIGALDCHLVRVEQGIPVNYVGEGPDLIA